MFLGLLLKAIETLFVHTSFLFQFIWFGIQFSQYLFFLKFSKKNLIIKSITIEVHILKFDILFCVIFRYLEINNDIIGHVIFKIQYVYGGYNLILLNPIYMCLIRLDLVKIYSRTKDITHVNWQNGQFLDWGSFVVLLLVALYSNYSASYSLSYLVLLFKIL